MYLNNIVNESHLLSICPMSDNMLTASHALFLHKQTCVVCPVEIFVVLEGEIEVQRLEVT